MSTCRGLLLLLVCLPPLAGCAQTLTMRELGFPVFTAVVGESARYERLPVAQGVDGRPVEGAVGAVHLAQFWPVPAGDADTVFLAVGVQPVATTAPLAKLAVAAYPLHRDALEGFYREGRLPPGSRPLAFAEVPVDEDGALRLLLRVPRDQLPLSAEYVALPILVVYADGWIQLRFYRTFVPEPYDLDEEPSPGQAPASEAETQPEPPHEEGG